MFRTLFSSRLFVGGLVVCVLVCTGIYLWGQHAENKFREQEAETHRFLQQLKERQAAQAVPTTEQTEAALRETDTTVSNADDAAEVFPDIPDAVPEGTDTGALQTHGETANEISEETTADVLVSPYGFGPYPDIPEGCPVLPHSAWHAISSDMELLFRVSIQKWNEGERFRGGSIEDGKVYLHYPNTLYVLYGEPVENDDGTITRPITYTKSAGIGLSPQQMRDGEIPSGIRVLDFDQEGINPYEYLELP